MPANQASQAGQTLIPALPDAPFEFTTVHYAPKTTHHTSHSLFPAFTESEAGGYGSWGKVARLAELATTLLRILMGPATPISKVEIGR